MTEIEVAELIVKNDGCQNNTKIVCKNCPMVDLLCGDYDVVYYCNQFLKGKMVVNKR